MKFSKSDYVSVCFLQGEHSVTLEIEASLEVDICAPPAGEPLCAAYKAI